MTTVHYRYATVCGRRLFHREAGPAGAPALVLLHGFPASSFTFRTNLPLYPRLHAYLRQCRVPLLAVWGRNDPIFGPDGARAFADDAPGAEIHLLDGGNFLLESQLDAAAGCIGGFLERTLP